MEYKAPLDNVTKAVTICVTILFITIIAVDLIYFNDSKRIATYITVSILITIYLGCFMMSPRGYILTEDDVIVRRAVGNVIINRDDIAHMERIESNELNWTIRTWGVGGLFGYFGKFTNAKFGEMIWYASNKNCMLLIVTKSGKKIVLSPQNPKNFINDYSRLELAH